MKKKNIIKSNLVFDRIIKNNKSYRNKVKRQLKDIIDKNNYEKGFNCIIIVRKGILNKSFQDMKIELNECFEKLKIIKENNNEK